MSKRKSAAPRAPEPEREAAPDPAIYQTIRVAEGPNPDGIGHQIAIAHALDDETREAVIKDRHARQQKAARKAHHSEG